MNIIEPCCTQKHWPALREKIGADGTTMFHGYGDLSLTELMPVMLTRYANVDMMLVCPTLPDGAAELLELWLHKKRTRMDGHGTVDTIAHLTIVSDLRKKKSPIASGWVKENPFPDRLILHNIQQNDTCILLPDLVVYGNLNLIHNGHFTALASTNQRFIKNLRETYQAIIKG